MILKNIINCFDILSLLTFLTYIYILNLFLITTDIRNKFFIFIINIFIFISIGLYYNLDGLILLFFISELTVILIFIVLFSQIYTHSKPIHKEFTLIFITILCAVNYNYYEIKLLNHNNFYTYSNIIYNDFYYIYNVYFEKQILITIFILFIITLYSVFFILLYYKLKEFSYNNFIKKKNLFLLRKQNIIHQNNYNTKIRLFKNKN